MPNGLLSWGRFPNHPQASVSVSWRRDLPDALAGLTRMPNTTLPFGNGRSYGDSCLAASDRVLLMRGLDRIIQADWTRGVVVVEPGMTLGELLAVAIPHGWFLRVVPGTQFVTVGGAIANDVHGKNHHRQGTFGCHVSRLGLLRSNEGSLTCSPGANPALFAATIGGLGLTGVICWAELQLQSIRSTQISSVTQRFDNIEEFFALSNELDPLHEFSVAWVDCAAKGSSTGRGVYMAGDFAEEGGLLLSRGATLSVPFVPPVSLVNRVSLRAFNEAYWRSFPRLRKRDHSTFESFFFPLDRILHWNRMYGPRGFQQYQCVLPPDAAVSGVKTLLGAIADSGAGSFLAVLKQFGEYRSPGLLSFPLPGVTLALDFPNHGQRTDELFQRLDAIVREANGRLYPAKDAHMNAADFQRAYPQWEELEALRDPGLNSRFWQRVTR
jgi:FAD/FMN-containing dehydrogenase